MKIHDYITLENFDAWSGGEDTKETIIDNGKEEEFNFLIEQLYPEGITENGLNDLLRFDEEWIFQQLGIIDY